MADVSGILAAGNAPQSNPLGLVQGYQNLANSITQNKLTQQQIENAKLANQTGQQNLANTRTNVMAQKLYAIQALPDDQVGPEAQRILDDSLKSGIIDQNHYDIGQKIIGTGDPGKIRQYATLGLVGTLAGPDAVHMVAGTPYIMNNGQSLQPGMVGGQLSQNPGAFTPAGQPTQVYPSRSELLTQQPGVDANTGAPTNTPLVNRAQQQGAGNLTGPAGNSSPPRLPGMAPPQTGTQPAQGGSGSPAAGPAAPSGSPTGQPSQNPSGSVVTGLPPGSDIPMKQSAQQFADDRQNASTFASRTFPLQSAIQLYKEGVSTGPGSDWINNVKSFILARAQNLGLDPKKVEVAGFDELNKYLTQYVTANPMAAGSDARLASALTGNPSVHISTLAGQNVARAALALERMRQAAVMSYNGTPQGYSNYVANYATHVDPRAFAVDLMTPKEQEKMIDAMKPQERKQFADSYAMAKRLGLLSTNAMPGPQ